MRKILKYIFISLAVLAVIAAAFISVVFWALNTAEGTRVLLTVISTFSPLHIEAREISGRLRDDLTLRGFRLVWSQLELTADMCRLKWEAPELWNRKLIIHDLSLERAVLKDNRPKSEEPISYRWPSVPLWLPRFDGRLQSFQVNHLIYRRPPSPRPSPPKNGGEGEFTLDEIFARLSWEGEILSINDFRASGPPGSASGELKWGIGRPGLELYLQAKTTEDQAGFDSFLLKARLEPVNERQEAEGNILLTAAHKNIERLHLESNLHVTRTGLNFRGLRLFQPGRQGILQGEGEIVFGANPTLQLKADFARLNLAPELGTPTDLAGNLEMKGSQKDYQGQISIANAVKGWQGGQATVLFRGNQDGLEVRSLHAAWLGGSVRGPFRISWVKGISIQGRLQGRNLNPALINPDVKGDINADLDGKFVIPDTKVPEASFKADLLPSRVFDRELSGDLAADLRKNILNIGRLNLRGPGFELRGKGVLEQQVILEANVADLSGLIPGSKGRGTASGWARFKDNRLSGELTGQGNDLTIQEISARAFRATVRVTEFSPKTKPDVYLDLRAETVQARSVPIESAALIATGNQSAHHASLTVLLAQGEVHAEGNGSYDGGVWKGTIQKLSARDRFGLWNLQKPAPVILSSRQFFVSPLILKSDSGEAVNAKADLSLDPFLGSLQAQWESINLARANPWLSQASVAGQTTGSGSVQWKQKGPQISAQTKFNGTLGYAGPDRNLQKSPLTLPLSPGPGERAGVRGEGRGISGEGTPTRQNHEIKIEVSSGRMKLDWDEKGLLAMAAFNLTRGGNLEGKFSSPQPFKTSIPEKGKASAQWKELDLAPLVPLLPEGLAISGKNSGQLAGQWFPASRFEASGLTRMSRGRVTWKAKDKVISTNVTAAEVDFSWQGESLKGNLSVVSAEYGGLKGTFLIPLSARFSPSLRPESPLKISLLGRLQESGLLASLYPEEIEKSRGKMDLNVNAEGTWSKPRFEGVLQISDAGFQFSRTAGREKTGRALPPHLWEVPAGSANFDWGPQGLSARLKIDLRKNGRIEGTLSSPEPARFVLPKDGKGDFSWTGLDLEALQPFMPANIFPEGQAAGQLQVQLLPGLRFDATGGFKVAQGKLNWRGETGLLTAGLNHSAVDFTWRGERLQGNVDLALADYGSLKGDFLLPLPAHAPFQFVSAGPVRVSLQGRVQERGLLSAFFPGMVEETRGNLDFSLTAHGTWGNPVLLGTLQLTNAAAYLPTLGIHVQDVSSRWKMQDNEIRVESFQARSGPGRLEGTATLWLQNGKLERYQGSLTGEKFQTLYRPDLRIQSSPKLNFQGTPRGLSVRGEVLLPEVEVYDMSRPGVVRTSSDVVIIDQPPSPEEFSRSLDIEVKIILGDQARVKAAGLDTRVTGSADLKIIGLKPENMSASGEVRTVGGLYTGYGQNLTMEHGRVIYSGGPVDNPALDILAVKKSVDLKREDIRVGVSIIGTLKNPIVKLYSQPAMKEEDILSYLLVGKPYDPKQGNLGLLLRGASGLLSGASPGVIDRLKGELGIDTLDILSSPTATTASTTTGGSTTASATGEFQRSLVTVGKYLTPQLYVSYGYSVFTSEQLLTLRYEISKHWEIETRRGNALGVDLYYRINFY